MIIKSLSRKSNTGQLVNYIFKYVFQEKDKNTPLSKQAQSKSDKSKFIIRHGIRSRSVKGITKEFKENEKYRLVHRKDSVKLFHTIISFSNKDKEKINDKLLKDIAQKFIQERGLNNMYAGTKHENKDHIHIHLIISGTQLNGRSSRISKQKFHSIKLSLQKYQQEKYPQLVHSLPEHGKGQRIAKEAIVQQIKTERQTNKQTLLETLEKALSASKSQEQFISKLTEAGHKPYYRNGGLQGIRFDGKTKYRFSRLGIDKTRLQALKEPKLAQDKALRELQAIRAGRCQEAKRSILEQDSKKAPPATLDKNEQKLMDELSDVRSGNNDRELGGGDVEGSRSIAPANDELNDKEEESKEAIEEDNTDDTDNQSSEME